MLLQESCEEKLGVAGKSLALAFMLILCCPHGRSQTEQVLPEVDTYFKLNSDVRVSFQAKQTRESSDPVQAEIGPSLDFYLKRLVRLHDTTRFDLDDSKSRPLALAIGYRYLPQANGAAATNRMEPVVTFRFPVKDIFLLTDRNRCDLDWKNGNFTWRYRNRFEIEKALSIRSYHPALYGSVEPFYESQYRKWSNTAVYAGCLFPIGKHAEFNPYYEHQNSTGKSPNQQSNQLGLMLNLYL